MRRWGAAYPAACAAAMSLMCCSQRAADDAVPAASAGVAAPSTPAAISGPSAEIPPRLLRRFQPLPRALEDDKSPRTAKEVDLGRMLYFDPRLSRDGDLSCNSCHNLDDYGVDHQRFSTGQGKQLGGRNAPTVYNAAGFFVQFWDGRAPNVEGQAKEPIVNPAEMAMPDGAHVVATFKAIAGYVQAFHEAFPAESDPLTFDNVGRAIGAFERGLVTRDAGTTFFAATDPRSRAQRKRD